MAMRILRIMLIDHESFDFPQLNSTVWILCATYSQIKTREKFKKQWQHEQKSQIANHSQ